MKTTVWITGGSEGIGFSYAKHFAKEGCSIGLIARNKEKLQKAKEYLEDHYDVDVQVYLCDLSVKEELQKCITFLNTQTIDIFINNAGRGYTGKCEDCSMDTMITINALNITAVQCLSAAVGKKMVERKSGKICNICSTGAFQYGPFIAAYYSSKAAVLSFTRALSKEWKDTGVKVQAVCFGPVKTEFYAKSNGKAPSFAMDPDTAVKIALKSKKNTVIVGFVNRLCLLLPASLRSVFVYHSKLKQISEER